MILYYRSVLERNYHPNSERFIEILTLRSMEAYIEDEMIFCQAERTSGNL